MVWVKVRVIFVWYVLRVDDGWFRNVGSCCYGVVYGGNGRCDVKIVEVKGWWVC